jgi:hypothetical protein
LFSQNGSVMTPEITIAEALRIVAEQLPKHLSAAGIYDIDAYGWLDSDTVDSEYVGHAMWQLNPPYEPDFAALTGEAPAQQRPSGFARDLVTNGADFEGLIKAARLAAGLMLAAKEEQTEPSMGTQPLFWLNHMTCILSLSMASDRLRTYFVIAATGQRFGKYKPLDGEPAKYALTFERARTILSERRITDAPVDALILCLIAYAERIQPFRTRRNRLVHGIATHIGRESSQLAKREAELFDERARPLRVDEHHIPKENVPGTSSNIGDYRQAITDVVEWYNLLLDASAKVFELEYILRGLARPT